MSESNPYIEAELLRREHLLAGGARSIIEPDDCWVQHVVAVDTSGDGCDADDPEAVAYCATGAVSLAGERDLEGLRSVGKTEGPLDMSWTYIYNAAAMRLFDRMAELIKRRDTDYIDSSLMTTAMTTVQNYNDAPETQHADVLSLFERARDEIEVELTECSRKANELKATRQDLGEE